MMKKLILSVTFCFCVISFGAAATLGQTQFKVLATNKTSTMEKELNQAAGEGFHYEGVTGGQTSFGGSEVLVILSKRDGDAGGRFQYKLLATSKTSTMQKELQQAGNEGFEYKGQQVFKTTFGGDEVVVILERDTKAEVMKYEYLLLATSKTSTMQKELTEAGAQGYEYVGVTVGKTAIGGNEVVVILRRGVKL